jgi:hypothetical protein
MQAARLYAYRARNSPLFRWVLALTLGPPLSLLVGSIVAQMVAQIAGLIGFLLGGLVIGAGIGLAGWLALRPLEWMSVFGRRWITWSALGGLIGILPAFLAGLLGALFGWQVSLGLGGAVFAAILGAAQALVLRRAFPEREAWALYVIAQTFGGLIGAALGLPFGSLIYALITGWSVLKSAEFRVLSDESSTEKKGSRDEVREDV